MCLVVTVHTHGTVERVCVVPAGQVADVGLGHEDLLWKRAGFDFRQRENISENRGFVNPDGLIRVNRKRGIPVGFSRLWRVFARFSALWESIRRESLRRLG